MSIKKKACGIVWLFDNPKDYPEMLKKIATTVFFIVLLGLLIISHLSNDFEKFMKDISWYELDFSIMKLQISYIYIPGIVALLESILKLHDRISDIFRIRFSFDKYVILKRMMEICSLGNKLCRVSRKNRKVIMNNVFYKYAGYDKPSIDKHKIYMALGMWSWFWIIEDLLFVYIILCALYLIQYFSWAIMFILFSIFVFLVLCMLLIRQIPCKRYAIDEVEEILEDRQRKRIIRNYFLNI